MVEKSLLRIDFKISNSSPVWQVAIISILFCKPSSLKLCKSQVSKNRMDALLYAHLSKEPTDLPASNPIVLTLCQVRILKVPLLWVGFGEGICTAPLKLDTELPFVSERSAASAGG